MHDIAVSGPVAAGPEKVRGKHQQQDMSKICTRYPINSRSIMHNDLIGSLSKLSYRQRVGYNSSTYICSMYEE